MKVNIQMIYNGLKLKIRSCYNMTDEIIFNAYILYQNRIQDLDNMSPSLTKLQSHQLLLNSVIICPFQVNARALRYIIMNNTAPVNECRSLLINARNITA